MADRKPRPRWRALPGRGGLAARQPVLDAHAAAPHARRPRAAPRRGRSHGDAAPPASPDPRCDSPTRRTPALGRRPRLLAPDAALRRGAPPRVATRVPARDVLPRRDAALGCDPRAAARARLVHGRVEASVRRRDVARLAHAVAALPLVGPLVLRELHARRPAHGRRRDADRGLVRDGRRGRLAPLPCLSRKRGAAATPRGTPLGFAL